MLVKNEQNQSCSKLLKIMRKLVENWNGIAITLILMSALASHTNKLFVWFYGRVWSFQGFGEERRAPTRVWHKNIISGPNMAISESASHFCKYKGNDKIYKGKLYPIFFLDKTMVTYSFTSAHLSGRHSLSPDELKDTHIGKIAYNKIARPMAYSCNLVNNCIQVQFYVAYNFIKMGIFQLVWTSGSFPLIGLSFM